jgi:hypothetical protein
MQSYLGATKAVLPRDGFFTASKRKGCGTLRRLGVCGLLRVSLGSEALGSATRRGRNSGQLFPQRATEGRFGVAYGGQSL